MKRGRERKGASFAEFVFTATGADTDLKGLSAIDLFDNVIVECDRLHAIKELMQAAGGEVESHELPNISLLLGDVEARLRTILSLYKDSTELARGRARFSSTPGRK